MSQSEIYFLLINLGGTFVFLVGFLAWKYRYFYLKGRIRVYFVGEDERSYPRVIKIGADDKKFFCKVGGTEHTYTLLRNRMYRSGIERLPTLYYRIGYDLPIDMLGENEGAISSVRYREVAKQKIMADLLGSFKKPKVDNATMLIVIVCITLLGFAALGIFMDSKFKELAGPAPVSRVENAREF